MFTSIDGPESIFTGVAGINGIGMAAGGYKDTNGVFHGFVRIP
jgi:hypothetical protein